MSKRFFAVTISAFVAGALAYTVSTTKPYVSPTASMEPTVLAGDHMLVKKMSGAPKRGGLVWFHPPTGPKQHFLKRVVGVPGDHIRFVNKAVYLNGKPLDEPYAVHKTDFTDPYRDNFPGGAPTIRLPEPGAEMLAKNVIDGELIVPENSYFVLGDNRDNSLDSRYFGCVPAANLTGRPLFIYWSVDKATGKTRWSRTFRVI